MGSIAEMIGRRPGRWHVVRCIFNGRRIVIGSDGVIGTDEGILDGGRDPGGRWVRVCQRVQLVPAPEAGRAPAIGEVAAIFT